MSNLRIVATNLVEGASARLLNGSVVIVTNCECVATVNQITRASGDFDADKVKIGALLSGTIAARFPGSTRVTAVTPAALTMSNNANTSTTPPESGTFTPNLARDEVVPYVMENALTNDRRVVWKQNSGGAMFVDIDLGGNLPISYAGTHGHKGTPSGIFNFIFYTATNAQGYPPSGGGFTSRISRPVQGAPDFGGTFTQVSARYVRFELDAVIDPFYLGKFVVGKADDLGILGSSIDETYAVPQMVERSVGDDPAITVLGTARPRWRYVFKSIDATKLGLLRPLGGLGKSFVILDKDDAAHDVIAPDGFDNTLTWISGGVGLYDASIRLEKLV
jgi:hypothetical protein